MLFICTDPTAPKYVAAEDNIEEWGAEMETRGVALHGDRLRPVEDATTVTVRGGEVVVSAGPFAETQGWIAGYDIIKCADLDEAIEGGVQAPHGEIRQDRDQAGVAARRVALAPLALK